MFLKRQREAVRAARGSRGRARGAGRMGWLGGWVVGNKEAAEKVYLKDRCFIKYHSITTVL